MAETCMEHCSSEIETIPQQKTKSSKQKTHELTSIKKMIGIASGKGGVGKSIVTSLLASKMQKLGYKCAILDADITGPSIPNSFGIETKIFANQVGMFPATSEQGTKIVSVNLMIDDVTDPIMWKAPIICGMVKQFYSEVIWKDIDYMFVDLPSGTSDVPLTVYQSLPLDGVIIVSTPQKMVSMIVEKAVKMTSKMKIPIIGVVENMSYINFPGCDEKMRIFGESRVEETASLFGVEVTDRLPIDPKLARLADQGNIESYDKQVLTNTISHLQKML